jgi:hypothetical protein
MDGGPCKATTKTLVYGIKKGIKKDPPRMNPGGRKKRERRMSVDWIRCTMERAGTIAGQVAGDQILFPVVGIVGVSSPELALFMV